MTCDTSKATPWKNTKKLTFRLAAMQFCTSMLSCHTRRPLYSYFSQTANQYIFDEKKYSTFPPKDSALLTVYFLSCKDELTDEKFDLLYIRSWLKPRWGQIWTQLWSELWRTSNCVYQISHDFACTLDPWQKRGQIILALTPLLTNAKGGIKYLNGFDMHLIPVNGKVKHDNNFDSTFDAFKCLQRHHGFGYLYLR